jgi:hypothetical protein
MPASVSWPGRARRTLAEQAERLRQSLESLGQQLRESIAGEVARAVPASATGRWAGCGPSWRRSADCWSESRPRTEGSSPAACSAG